MHTSNQLLYHVMSMLKSNTSDQVFELVVDLTQASSLNEPDVSTLLAQYLLQYLESHVLITVTSCHDFTGWSC